MDLKGQRVLITGANRGIGLSHARYFASLGASLVLSATQRSLADLQAQADALSAQGCQVWAIAADLPDAAEQVVASAVERLGGLDAVVHNAGAVCDRTLAKLSDKDWQSVLDVHLGSAFLISRAVWPVFKAQQFGRLVFTSSAAGLYGNFGQSNYSAAKMGLVGLARTISLEGKRHNIAANCIAPVAATEMNRSILPASLSGRLPTSAISPLAAYLCHPACKENGSIFEAAAGQISKVFIAQSEGASFVAETLSLDALHDNWADICAARDLRFPADAAESLKGLLDRLPPSRPDRS